METDVTDHIYHFWENQAKLYGSDHAASWGDNWAIQLELDEIGKYIYEGAEVLDVGCANGFSVLAQLERKPKRIVGLDFSPSMIAEANKVKANLTNADHISFQVGDIRSIELPDDSFDVVYTTRVLINLPTWEEQKQGINECLRVCRNGGKVIISEGFWEPLALLNAMRALVNLAPLVEHDFNRYIKKSRLEQFLTDKEIDYENVDYTSLYYLGSRLLRELITDSSTFPGYSNPVNREFFNLEQQYSGGGFGIQQIYCIVKP